MSSYIDFYANLYEYNKKNSLQHAGIKSYADSVKNKVSNMQYGYYNKIDNFYGPGKARYFYTKDEWDAYQRQSNALQKKAKDEVKYAKEIKENREKYSNVNEAQKAREQSEKQGQKTTQIEQRKRFEKSEITEATDNIRKELLNNIIYNYGDDNTRQKLKDIQKKYDVDGEKAFTNYIKDPKWQKLYNAHVRNYNSDDPEYENAKYEMTQIQNKYHKERASELAKDIKDLIKNDSNPDRLAYYIMRNPYVKRALSGDKKVYNELMSFIRTLPLDYNTATGVKGVKNKDVKTWEDVEETFDNSKNIKRWN